MYRHKIKDIDQLKRVLKLSRDTLNRVIDQLPKDMMVIKAGGTTAVLKFVCTNCTSVLIYRCSYFHCLFE